MTNNSSQVCIDEENREAYVERRVRTDLDGFQRALSNFAGARVLLEASIESGPRERTTKMT
ncbi:MAG: hypothetical protein ACFCGT_00550 [Sandaracinaceae bacterium]